MIPKLVDLPPLADSDILCIRAQWALLGHDLKFPVEKCDVLQRRQLWRAAHRMAELLTKRSDPWCVRYNGKYYRVAPFKALGIWAGPLVRKGPGQPGAPVYEHPLLSSRSLEMAAAAFVENAVQRGHHVYVAHNPELVPVALPESSYWLARQEADEAEAWQLAVAVWHQLCRDTGREHTIRSARRGRFWIVPTYETNPDYGNVLLGEP